MKVSLCLNQTQFSASRVNKKGGSTRSFSSAPDMHSYRKQYKSYSLFDTARREKHMRTVKPKLDLDADVLPSIYENFGDFTNLNLDLVRRHAIPPVSGESYRNPLPKTLIQFSTGELDKAGAVHVTNTVKPSKSASFLVGKTLDANKFSELKEEVFEEHFMSASQIFVTDASVGSQPSEYYVRVISDSANDALFLRKALIPAPVTSDPAAFKFDITVYVMKNLSSDVVGQRLSTSNSSFAVYDSATKSAYLAGEFSSGDILNVIANAVSIESLSEAERVVLPLACDVVGKTSFDILFPSSPSVLQGADVALSGTMNAFLQNGSITRFWNSTFGSASNLPKGSFVETVNNAETNQKTTHAVHKLSSAYTMNAPGNVVFLVEDKNFALPVLSKLSVEQSVLFFAAGYRGSSFQGFYGSQLYANSDPNQISNLYKSLLESNKTNSFVINTTPKGQALKPTELKALLASVNNGSAAKAATVSGLKLLSPVKSVEGVQAMDEKTQPKEKEFLAAVQSKVANITAVKSLLS